MPVITGCVLLLVAYRRVGGIPFLPPYNATVCTNNLRTLVHPALGRVNNVV